MFHTSLHYWWKMAGKCYVPLYRLGYVSWDKTTIFSLLDEKKYLDDHVKLLKVISRSNIPDSTSNGICELHWPQDYKTAYTNGLFISLFISVCLPVPPSEFPNIPPRIFATLPPPSRPTQRSNIAVPCIQENEQCELKKLDKVNPK